MSKIEISLFYRGKSMKGTFKPGDLLFIKKIKINSIKRGDVVVFRSGGIDPLRLTVHRVIENISGIITTKGDNNNFNDKKKTTEKEIIGRVEFFERAGKKKRIRGGYSGFLHSKIYRIKLFLKKTAYHLLVIPYNLIKKSNIALLFPKPKLKKIWLNTREGHLVKFLYKKRVVAKWYPEKNAFFCRKPFNLFLKKPDINSKRKNLIKVSYLRQDFFSSGTEGNFIDDD